MQFENLLQLSEQVKELDRPFFKSVSVEGKDANNFRAVVSSNSDDVLGIMSKRYSIVQSQDVLYSVISALQELGLHDVVGTLAEQKGRTYCKILLPRWVSEGNTDKDIQLGFLLINSYDATKSLELQGFAIRQVCSNGMVLPKTLGTAFVRKHIGNIVLETAEAVKGMVDKIINQSPYLSVMIEKAIAETFEDIEKAEAELQEMGYGKRTIDNIMQRISTNKPSKWELYNAVTYFYSHKKITEKGRIDNIKKAEKLLVVVA